MSIGIPNRQHPDGSASDILACPARFGDLELWKDIPREKLSLYLRFTLPMFVYWKYLLDWNGREAVFLLDSTLGQESISLSRGFDQVISLVPSHEAGERVKELAKYHGCDNLIVVESMKDVEEHLFGKIRNIALHDISAFISSANNPLEVSASIERVVANARNATTIYVSGIRKGGDDTGSKRILDLLTKRRRGRTGSIRVLFEPTLSGVSEIIPMDAEGKDFLHVRHFISRFLKYGKYVWRGGKALGEGEYTYLSLSAKTFLEILLDTLRSRSTGSGDMRVGYIRKGNPLNVMVSLTGGSEEGFIARIPMNRYANDRTRKAYENIETIGKKYGGCGGTVPAPAGTWDISGETVYLEKRVVGRCIETRKSMDNRLYRLGVEWISAFHLRTMEKRNWTNLDFRRLVEEPVSQFASCLDAGGKKRIERMTSHLADRMLDREFPFVFMHGDFKLENIIFRGDLQGIAGIIDWDLGCEQGVPVLDLLNLIFFHRWGVSGRPYHQLMEEIVRHRTLSIDEQRALKSYFGLTGIDVEGKTGVFLALFWLYYVSMRTVPYIWSVGEWRQSNVNPILDMLSDDEWWDRLERVDFFGG